ncbi:DUF4333 domain-containing protein [Nocardia xishanensis]|uniref:DUF4333 domain-containing protein n=1 Tax=Nocardia xishanensis TaxID=238964 RepID=UPI0033D44E9E
MVDQQNFARTVMAVSSAVVAICAVAVTVKVMGTDLGPVEQPRVLDQAALEQQVANMLQGVGDEPAGRVSCPGAVVVEVGNQFECQVRRYLHSANVLVKIVSDQGEITVDRS